MQIKELSNLIQLGEQSTLDYFEYSENGNTIIFKKEKTVSGASNPLPIHSTVLPVSEKITLSEEPTDLETPVTPQDCDDLLSVRSQVIGIAALNERISPEGKDIKVSKGMVLCTICAMKVYTDIVSPTDGVIRDILFENNDMVECGQELFRIQVAT